MEGLVKLRLVRGKGDVFAHLPQEFAFAAAETLRFTPRRDQHAENLALHQERRGHERMQSFASELPEKGKLGRGDVGLVNQFPADAAGKAVLAHLNTNGFGLGEFRGERLAADADAGEVQHAGGRLVKKDAGEVERQVLPRASGWRLERCSSNPAVH